MACYIDRRDLYRAFDQNDFVLLAVQLTLGVYEAGRQPNAVLVITGDPGYPDLGCLGHPLRRIPDNSMGYSGRV